MKKEFNFSIKAVIIIIIVTTIIATISNGINSNGIKLIWSSPTIIY